jgi:hypothetical protein
MLQVQAMRIVHIAVLALAAAVAHGPAAAQPATKRGDAGISGDAAVLAAREAFGSGDRNRLALAAAAIGEHPLK